MAFTYNKSCGRRPAQGKNIFWSRISPGTVVKDCGTIFVAGEGRNKRLVYWGSQDARTAQKTLAQWARRGKR